MTEKQLVTAPDSTQAADIDLCMNVAVGQIETYIESLGFKPTPEQIEWYAHQVALRILDAHEKGEATY